MAARKAGVTKHDEPPIPALPPEVTAHVSALYVSLHERVTGQAW